MNIKKLLLLVCILLVSTSLLSCPKNSEVNDSPSFNEASRAKPTHKKESDIRGPAGYELGTPISEVNTEGMLSMCLEEGRDTRSYIGQTTYSIVGIEFPMQLFLLGTSSQKGEGVISVYGIAALNEGKLDEEELDVMLQMAEKMKSDLLDQYDASLIYEDEQSADFFNFEMRDADGDSVNVKVDTDGIRYRYRDAAAIAWADEQEEAESHSVDKTPEVLSELETEYEVKNLVVAVHKYESRESLGSKTKDGAKFVIVELTATNKSLEEVTFYSNSYIRLIDSKNRRFKADSDAIGKLKNYMNSRCLAPDIPERGRLAFMVPADSSGWKLVIADD